MNGSELPTKRKKNDKKSKAADFDDVLLYFLYVFIFFNLPKK